MYLVVKHRREATWKTQAKRKGIKMDNKEIQLEDTDWIHPVKDRDKWRGCFDHGNSPLCSIKGGNFFTT
jgi:hypothetical protein